MPTKKTTFKLQSTDTKSQTDTQHPSLLTKLMTHDEFTKKSLMNLTVLLTHYFTDFKMATLKLSLALLFVAIKASCQMISPCPRLFTYEPQNPNEPDRWYGQLILQSDSELQGVWLRVVFDKPSIQLGVKHKN